MFSAQLIVPLALLAPAQAACTAEDLAPMVGCTLECVGEAMTKTDQCEIATHTNVCFNANCGSHCAAMEACESAEEKKQRLKEGEEAEKELKKECPNHDLPTMCKAPALGRIGGLLLVLLAFW